MTDKKTEALKLALSTLANARDWIGNDPEGRWDEDEMYDELCNMVKYVRDALADSALDRMAENARELGLDYEPIQCPICKAEDSPYPKCGCVTYVEQQEPVAVTYQEAFETMQALYSGNLKQQSIAVEFGKTKFYTSPQPSKPWVGLTPAEAGALWKVGMTPHEFSCAIEAKLKERNT